MSIDVKCPQCGHSYNFPPDAAGVEKHCFHCGTKFSIPLISSEETKAITKREIHAVENPFQELKRLGHYRIEKQIGHGGMGYVFKAVDIRSSGTVAIKVIAPDFFMDESMVERFRREASLLKKLQHPNIVRLIDISMEGEFRYYVMEFVSGRNLAEEIKGGPLPVNEITGIAWQVADALGTAHEAGIIHRDIKPANIMRDEAGTIKLTDFGIARVIGVSGGTTAGKFVGTPAYMSPEQVLGKALGTTSDIYSFGVVLYEMLTGKVPFESSNPLDVMRKHVYEDPLPPKELNHDVPGIFSQLVMRMLRKKRDERINNGQRVSEPAPGLCPFHAGRFCHFNCENGDRKPGCKRTKVKVCKIWDIGMYHDWYCFLYNEIMQ